MAGIGTDRVGHCRNILTMNYDKLVSFLNSFDVVIMGCDGVVWQFREPILNAGNAINILKQRGKVIKFLTNNSLFSDEEYIAKFSELGVLDVVPSDIITTSKTITRFIKQNVDQKAVFSLCSEKVNQCFERAGIRPKTKEPNILMDRSDVVNTMKAHGKVGAVVLDLNFNITYCQLTRAYNYLKEEGCLFIVGATDTFFPVSSHVNILGMSGFMNMLRDCCGKDPIVLGKPGPVLINDVFDQFGISYPTRVLFIGDSLKTDIKFGVLCRFQTLLVLSGVTKLVELMETSDHLKPDYISYSIADFIRLYNNIDEHERSQALEDEQSRLQDELPSVSRRSRSSRSKSRRRSSVRKSQMRPSLSPDASHTSRITATRASLLRRSSRSPRRSSRSSRASARSMSRRRSSRRSSIIGRRSKPRSSR